MSEDRFDWGSLADLIEDIIKFHNHNSPSHPADLVTQVRAAKPPLKPQPATAEKVLTAVRNDIVRARIDKVEPRFEIMHPYSAGGDFVALKRRGAYRRGSVSTAPQVDEKAQATSAVFSTVVKASSFPQSHRSAARLAIEQATPYEFEALVEKLLKSMGMEQVQHTPLSRDNGIDVRGVLVIEGVIRVNLAVQVKKYANNVHSPDIQKLRGSLHVQETGLFITSGAFSQGAILEARQQGKTPISLIDGEEFVHLLIKHKVFSN